MMMSVKALLDNQAALPHIISWCKTTSAAINHLADNFQSLRDIVQPFVMSLRLVSVSVVVFIAASFGELSCEP